MPGDAGHTNESDNDTGKGVTEVDLFRDTGIRYLGYANEIGEAFHPIVPRLLIPSYVVAVGYVGADTWDKIHKARLRNEPTDRVVRLGCDVLVWQMLASVMIPGYTIRAITAGSKRICESGALKNLPAGFRRWTPTIVGLSTIPLIIHPIDHAVDRFMDTVFRQIWK
jgi:mitochondrial fission process protein 1